MDKYSNLTDEQIALICAKDIVEAEIREDWDFSDHSTFDVLRYHAYLYYQFLKDPTWEGYGKLLDKDEDEDVDD